MFARAFGIFCCFCFSTAAVAVAVVTASLLLLRLPLLLLLLLLLHYVLLVGPARSFFFFFQLSCESYMVMDVVQNPQKSSGYDQGTTTYEKKTCES